MNKKIEMYYAKFTNPHLIEVVTKQSLPPNYLCRIKKISNKAPTDKFDSVTDRIKKP